MSQPVVMSRKSNESNSPNSRCGEIPQPPVKSEWEGVLYLKPNLQTPWIIANTFYLGGPL